MIWKHLLLCGTLFISVLSISPNQLNACGWDPEWENEFYRFMSPEMAGQEMYKPFQFSWNALYAHNLLSPDLEAKDNSTDWSEWFGEGITPEVVREVVYNMKPSDLAAIQEKADGKRNVLPGNLSENALVRQWSKGKWREALDYLNYALRVEPYCLPGGDWDRSSADASGGRPLVQEGMAGYHNSGDDFIKVRYAYQVVRLLRYDGQDEEAARKFQELIAPLAHVDNTVYWWSVSHFAGALRYSKQPIEAAYQFSRVFDHCPTRRIHAFRGFRVNSDKQWQLVLDRCQNGHEKANLHFMRAIEPAALPMEEMRYIQEYAPGSQMADVLLLREINKIEGERLGYPFTSRKAFHKGLDRENQSFKADHLRELLATVEATLASKKMYDADLWRLSRPYLIFLSGDMDRAFIELERTRPQLSEAGALRGSLLDLVFRIGMTKKVNASVENTLLKDLTNLSARLPDDKAEEMREFMDEALGWLYEAQGQPAKALLARRRQWSIDEAQLPVVNDLLKFEAKPNMTLYEKQLLERMHGSVSHDNLLEIKGTRLLGKNLLPEAIKVFRSLPESYRTSSNSFSLEADPFQGHLHDIVNCDDRDCGDDSYTKLSLAETLLQLQQKAVKEPENAGKYYLLIGNAYYNTTFFGPAWRALDYHRSGGNWSYLGRYESWYQFDPESFEEVIDMTLPETYYEKAAESSRDPEMAALATFMAAKCELNRFYIAESNDKSQFQSHYATLVRQYQNTRIYDQLIRECFYFRQYAQN